MAFLLTVLVLLISSVASAQTPLNTSPREIRILSIGGFLGQLDGFCEQPGGTYDLAFNSETNVQKCPDISGKPVADWPVAMGGLLGAKSWVKSKKQTGDLVLIPGNNQVANFTFLPEAALLTDAIPMVRNEDLADPDIDRLQQTRLRFWRFWQEMKDLGADAIGMASEDFLRSLRDPRDELTRSSDVKNRGSILARWLDRVSQQPGGPVIISSNAAIKVKSTALLAQLNNVDNGDFKLAGITEDESVGWLTEVKVSHPEKTTATLTLLDVGPTGSTAPVNASLSVLTDATKTSTSLMPIKGSLDPARRYRVLIQVANKKDQTLEFQTHRALTPRDNASESFDGLPIVEKPWESGSPILILSLVDQSIKTLLGKDAWKWTNSGCPAKHECEIDILSPEAAVRAILARAFPPGAGRKPLIALISALEDDVALNLLTQFPEIRFVVLPPESQMLGRSAREYAKADDAKSALTARLQRRTAGQSYSGDLGLTGVFNRERPAGTMMVVRPEWIGETGAEMKAQVNYSEANEWHVAMDTMDVRPVPGAALHWAPCHLTNSTSKCTKFFMTWDNVPVPYGSFTSYEVCSEANPNPRCALFGKLKEIDEFKMFAGDAFRRGIGSELAVTPGGLIDPDAYAWFTSVFDASHTRVFTRFVLERTIYRSFRIVRAIVAGDKLVETLDKVLNADSHAGSCIVGIDSEACADAIDTKRPDRVLINGKLIDARQYYSIAMPEGLAEELALAHVENGSQAADAVSVLNERLSARAGKDWFMSGAQSDFASRIAADGNRRWQHNDIFSSLEIGFAQIKLGDPSGDIKKTDVEFRGISASETWTIKGNFDLAVLDHKWVALRGVTEADYSRKESGTKVTFDDNKLTAGGRLDVKLPPYKYDLRLYGGYFWEGELRGPYDYFTAKISKPAENGYSTVLEAKKATRFARDPLQFQYLAAGVDAINPFKVFVESRLPVKLAKLGVQYAFGKQHNFPVGADINGEKQPDERYEDSLQTVLDKYYEEHEGTFVPEVTFFGRDESRRQNRVQFDLNYEVDLKVGSKTWTFGHETRRRLYPRVSDTRDNSLRDSWRQKLSLTIPVAPRLQIVPSWEWQSAHIYRDNSQRFTQSRFETNFKVPLVFKAGWGKFFG